METTHDAAGLPRPNLTKLRAPYDEMQRKFGLDIEALVAEYRTIVLSLYTPCLHKWFISSFADATKWLEAREMYAKSVATWSVVGHIVGLGDRHSDNILLDTTCGECVFVDFDCLFDKGLTLSVPELVPFRLTTNMVDAFGVTGVEGTFRRSMEVCLGTLRDNKDSVISILEPFLYDPTVAWCRKGRAETASVISKSSKTAAASTSNSDAKETLQKIRDRLEGVYNLYHPRYSALVQRYNERGVAPPSRGLGALRGEEFHLSVQGQVQRLIEEAIAEENLAQMYIGTYGAVTVC
jgi:serine/threonine-protein kinase ATR